MYDFQHKASSKLISENHLTTWELREEPADLLIMVRGKKQEVILFIEWWFTPNYFLTIRSIFDMDMRYTLIYAKSILYIEQEL